MVKTLATRNLLPALFALLVVIAALVAPPRSNLGLIKLTGTLSAVPSVTAVDPTFGSDAGGATVIITGSNYFADPGTMVNFGATPASSFTVDSVSQITAVSPAHVDGTIDVTVTTTFGTSATSPSDLFTFVAGAPGRFNPMNPTRVLDTRSGPKLGPGASIDVPFAGISVPGNTTAVVINITATDTTTDGFFTVYPTAASRPNASNVNWVAGQTVPNLVMVSLGAGGFVTIYNAKGSANAVVDLEGYYAPPSGPTAGGFVALPPSRVADTRQGSGKPYEGLFLGPGMTREIQITGAGGVPGTGVEAVVVNATVTNTTAPSFLTAYPTGGSLPNASNLNWVAGKTIANRVVVSIGTGGMVTFYNRKGTTDLVIDVNGYFTDGTASGAQFVGVTPSRLVDTRNGTGGSTGRIAIGATYVVTVAGNGGVPAMGSATPPTAVVLNVTATGPTGAGYFTVYPGGTPRPTASDLNFLTGQTVPNLVVVQIGFDGTVNVANIGHGATHLVVDVVGWLG